MNEVATSSHGAPASAASVDEWLAWGAGTTAAVALDQVTELVGGADGVTGAVAGAAVA
ncbi:hypothetical protein [Terrabacter tumescens]|nr:hypothetical protein [Terrabacter tumescens]